MLRRSSNIFNSFVHTTTRSYSTHAQVLKKSPTVVPPVLPAKQTPLTTFGREEYEWRVMGHLVRSKVNFRDERRVKQMVAEASQTVVPESEKQARREVEKRVLQKVQEKMENERRVFESEPLLFL